MKRTTCNGPQFGLYRAPARKVSLAQRLHTHRSGTRRRHRGVGIRPSQLGGESANCAEREGNGGGNHNGLDDSGPVGGFLGTNYW